MSRIEAVDWLQRASPDRARTTTLRAHEHAALIYWSRQEYLETVVPYLVEGLVGSDMVVHISHDEPVQPVIEALESEGIDIAAVRASGQLVLLTAQEAFAPNGRFDIQEASAGIRSMIDAARAAGAPQLRFSVDISYVLGGTPGIEELMLLDASANEDMFPRHPFMCVCAYDASRGVNDLVEDMFLTHPLVFVRGIPLANPYYRPWHELSQRAAFLQRWKRGYAGAVARAAA